MIFPIDRDCSDLETHGKPWATRREFKVQGDYVADEAIRFDCFPSTDAEIRARLAEYKALDPNYMLVGRNCANATLYILFGETRYWLELVFPDTEFDKHRANNPSDELESPTFQKNREDKEEAENTSEEQSEEQKRLERQMLGIDPDDPYDPQNGNAP